jgi:hypothetical protein
MGSGYSLSTRCVPLPSRHHRARRRAQMCSHSPVVVEGGPKDAAADLLGFAAAVAAMSPVTVRIGRDEMNFLFRRNRPKLNGPFFLCEQSRSIRSYFGNRKSDAATVRAGRVARDPSAHDPARSGVGPAQQQWWRRSI